VAGDPILIERFEQLRKKLICSPRNTDVMRNNIIEMREKMRKHLDKPKHSAKSTAALEDKTFNIKQSRGVSVNIELIVQFVVLVRASDYACIADWSDNISQVQNLAVPNIIPSIEADRLIIAYQDYRAAAHLAALKQQGAELSEKLILENRKNVEKIWLKVFSARTEE
jgi:glutamate-ammonia-ligase adenylyltransferase